MGSSPLLVIGRFVLPHRSPGEVGEPTTECSEFSRAEETCGGTEGDSNGDPAGPTGLDEIGRHGGEFRSDASIPADRRFHECPATLSIPRISGGTENLVAQPR